MNIRKKVVVNFLLAAIATSNEFSRMVAVVELDMHNFA